MEVPRQSRLARRSLTSGGGYQFRAETRFGSGNRGLEGRRSPGAKRMGQNQGAREAMLRGLQDKSRKRYKDRQLIDEQKRGKLETQPA